MDSLVGALDAALDEVRLAGEDLHLLVAAFARVCLVLDSFEVGPALDAAISDVNVVCESIWSPARKVPDAWVATLLGGGREPRAAVARELRVQSLSVADLASLAAAPELQYLRVLTFYDAAQDFKPKFLKNFVATAQLGSLREMCFWGVPLTHTGLSNFLRSNDLGLLSKLVASSAQIKSRGGGVIAASGRTSQLTSLNLSMNALGDAGVSELVPSAFERLEALDLSENQLTSMCAGDLASLRAPHLKKLKLESADFRTTLAPLGEACWSATLQELGLMATRLDVATLQSLLDAFSGGQLQSLDLAVNHSLGGQGVGAALSTSPTALRLHSLNISHCGITDADVIALAGADFPFLRKLMLSSGAWTDRAVHALLSSSWFSQLQTFSMPKTLSAVDQEPSAGSHRAGRLYFRRLSERMLGQPLFARSQLRHPRRQRRRGKVFEKV